MAIERPNYYTGQFLKEVDFELEQSYHKDLLRVHNKNQHTPGVCFGMELTFTANTADALIGEGTTIDELGRILHIGTAGVALNFSNKAVGDWYVVISYRETPTGYTEETGIGGHTRTSEDPLVEILNANHTADFTKLTLAKVTLITGGSGIEISSVDDSVRFTSGVVAGESLIVSADPASMTSDQALKVDGDAYISGDVAIGTSSPQANMHVHKTGDNVARLGHNNGNTLTISIASGLGQVNLVAGAKEKADNSGYTYLGTPGASRIKMDDGSIEFFTSDSTTGTGGADAGGLITPRLSIDHLGDVSVPNGNLSVSGILEASGGVTVDGNTAIRHDNYIHTAYGITGKYGYFEVRDDTGARGALFGHGSVPGGYVNLTLTNGRNLHITGGNVGIGINAPTANLHVAGDLKLDIAEGLHFLGVTDYFDINRDARIIRMIDNPGVQTNGNVDGGLVIDGQTQDGITKEFLTIRGTGDVTVSTGNLSVENGDLTVNGEVYSSAGKIRDAGGGWVRTYGSTGWQNETHGGGWYMNNSTWIRTYGGKGIYQDTGIMRTDGTLQVGTNGSTFKVVNDGSFSYRGELLYANTLERIGIGTTTPQGKLHVRNSDDGGDIYSGIRLYPATNATTGKNSYHRIMGFRKSGLMISGSTNGSTYHKSNLYFKDEGFLFGTSDGTTNPENNIKMEITNAGDVSINDGDLTVTGAVEASNGFIVDGKTVINNTGLIHTAKSNSAGNYGYFEVRDTNNSRGAYFGYGDIANNEVYLKLESGNDLNIKGGSVGIDIKPDAKLHVAGDLKLDIGEGLHFLGETNYFGTNLDARIIRVCDNTGGQTNGNADGGLVIEGQTLDGIRKELMTIRGNGSVKISNGPLDISNGDLTVTGNIHTTGAITSPEGTLRDDGGGSIYTYGDTGWINQTHGGGWYMNNSSWIRSYGNKNILQNAGILRTDGTLQIGASGSTLNVVKDGDFAYDTDTLFANTAGNVGVNTTTPDAKLQVNGVGENIFRVGNSDGNSLSFDIASGSGQMNMTVGAEQLIDNSGYNFLGTRGAARMKMHDSSISFYTADSNVGVAGTLAEGLTTERLHINKAGDIGINTSAPQARLHIDGTLSGADDIVHDPANSANNQYGLFLLGKTTSHNMAMDVNEIQTRTNGALYGLHLNKEGGAVYANNSAISSDERKKKDIAIMQNPIGKIMKLNPVHFRWKNSSYSASDETGFLAQEIEKVYPHLVKSDEKGWKHLNYNGLIAPMARALQLHNSEIEKTRKQTQENTEEIVNFMRMREACDFAEYFESANGKSIAPGTSVVLEDGRIRAAKKDDTPFGIISANPNLIGGAYSTWPEKYLKDEFGATITEEHKEEIMKQKTEKVKSERQKVEIKTIEVTSTELVEKKVKGKKITAEVQKKEKREIKEPVYQEVDIYDEKGQEVIRTQKVPIIETYETEEPLFDENGKPVMIGTGKFDIQMRPKLNPKYDPKKKYTPRQERPEWNLVGLLGQIPLKKGQPVAPGWIKIKKVNKDVEIWLVK